MAEVATKKRVAIREDFLTSPLDNLAQVRLKGTRCPSCGEAFLGKSLACENCQSTNLEDIVLSSTGTLWTYTVIRHRPPGNFIGPDPYVPHAVGLIELPEGVRILAVLKGVDVDNIKLDIPMELVIEKLYDDPDGNEVITYKFQPAGGR